ncbi:hypothetical protein PPL_07785 [Heterostelium album PN500]|uniref:Uncharacterized protein n=1 Tax=Heterostelium pallidum (strain ATCC 26659 / Pp 5 / PN500) TaxID=670386 RepID=D3BGY3_HETP5|nr:hypothetical protein PPL_07785 [Heterostelium album PN500]EFA79367.1 hypothetical protein PPL_07785 [Heterostelium album PN500]|eukprot:XP_020431488.1 hypothetical protein PPL_07785 [Heterostelium album PN500]
MGRVILYLVLNCIKGNTFDEKDDYKYKSDFDNLQNISDDLRELLLELCDDKEHRIEYKGIVNHKWVQSKQLIQYIYSGDNIQKKDITLKDLYQIFKEKDEFSSEYIVFVSYYYDQDTLYLLEDTDRRHLYSVKTVSLFHINILKNCDKPTEHKEYQRLLTLYKTVLAEKNSLMAINMQKLLIPRPDSDVYKAADLLNYLSLLSSEVKATLLSTITSINIYDHYLEQSPLKVTPDIVESILMNNDCRALFKERYQKDMADYIVLVTDDKDQFSTLQSLQMKEIRSICMISLTINQKLKVKASDIYKQLVNVYSSLLNNNNKRSESDESNDIEAQERLQYLLPRVDSHMYNPYQLVYYLRVFVEQDKDEESVLSRPIAFSKYNDQLQVQSWDIHPKSIEELINQNYDYLKQYNMSISDYILLVSYTDTPDELHLLSSNRQPIYKFYTINAYCIKSLSDDSSLRNKNEYEQLVDLYESIYKERVIAFLQNIIPYELYSLLLPTIDHRNYEPVSIIHYIHILMSKNMDEIHERFCSPRDLRINDHQGISNHRLVQSKQLIHNIYNVDNVQKTNITLKDLYQLHKEKDELKNEYIVFVSYYYNQDTLYLLEDTNDRHLYSVSCGKPTEHKEYQRLLTLYKTLHEEKKPLSPIAINIQNMLMPKPDTDLYKASKLMKYLSLVSSDVKAILTTLTSINIYDQHFNHKAMIVTPDIVESIFMNNHYALFKEKHQMEMSDHIVLVTDDKDQFYTLQALPMKDIKSLCFISITINQQLQIKESALYDQLVNVYSSLLNKRSSESNSIPQERLQYLLPRIDSDEYNPYHIVYNINLYQAKPNQIGSVLLRSIAFSKYNDQLQVESWDITPKYVQSLVNQNYDYLKQYNMSISDYILLVSYTDTPDKRHLLSSNTKPIYKISTIHAYSIKNITLDDSPVIKSSEYEQLVDLYVSLLSERNDQLLTLIPEALCNMLLPKTHYKHYQPSNIIQYIHMLVSDEKLKSVIAQVNNVIPLSLYESYKEYKSIHQFSIMDYIAYLNHDYEQIKKNHSIEISNYLILGSIHEKPDSFFVLSYHSLFSMKSAYAFQITKVHDIIVPEYSPIHVALKGLYISLRKDKFSKIIGSMPQNIANIIAPPDSNIFKDKNMNIAYYINLIKSDSEIQTMINCMEEDLKGERNVHDLKIETLKRDLRNLNDYTAQNDKRISDITHEIHLLKNRNEAVKLRSSKEQVDINKQSLMNLKNSIDQLEKDRVESYEEMKIALSKGVKQKDDTELTKEEEKVEAVLLELSKKVDKLARELTDLEIKNQNNFNK